ncbi:MAG: hypothetical protein KBD83_05405 [Gammaproteobacteria bacterium]|nr:hypothetical protein [Gammaproteobacteria bacterium]
MLKTLLSKLKAKWTEKEREESDKIGREMVATKMIIDLYAYTSKRLQKRLSENCIASEGICYFMRTYAMEEFIERLANRELPYLMRCYPSDNYIIELHADLNGNGKITFRDAVTSQLFYHDAFIWPQSFISLSSLKFKLKKLPLLYASERVMFGMKKDEDISNLYGLFICSETQENAFNLHSEKTMACYLEKNG